MSSRGWLPMILVLYGLLGLGYSVLMPIWEAPDEPYHYDYALHVARHGRAPSRAVNPEALQPPLYYWLAAGPLLLLDRIDSELVQRYEPPRRPWPKVPLYNWRDENYRFLLGPHLLRWLNLALGAMTVWFVYRASREFVPGHNDLALTTAALAALTPQFLHMNASVSNDPLAYLAGAGLFWLLGRECSNGLTNGQLAGAAVAVLCLPAAIKLTLLPMSSALLLAVLWRFRGLWLRDLRVPLAAGVLVLAGVALLAWLAPGAAATLWNNLVTRSTHVRPGAGDFMPDAPKLLPWSYWGYVGWMAVGLPWKVVWPVTAGAALGAAASLRLVLPRLDPPGQRGRRIIVAVQLSIILVCALLNSWVAIAAAAVLLWLVYKSFQAPNAFEAGSRFGWCMVWIMVLLAVATVSKNALATGQLQGRFFFPVIGPLSLLMATGWRLLIPQRAAQWLLPLTLALMLSLNQVLWWRAIVPIYYQPFLE